MNAKYSPKKYIYFMFDLTADKDLELAYLFLQGANQNINPRGVGGEKLRAMEECLKWDIIAYNERVIESSYFSICTLCASEIDLRLGMHKVDTLGNHTHAKCPKLPDTEL